MRTTNMAVMISDSVAHIVHAGDSRAYIIGSDKNTAESARIIP